jgi:hypothetical protein
VKREIVLYKKGGRKGGIGNTRAETVILNGFYFQPHIFFHPSRMPKKLENVFRFFFEKIILEKSFETYFLISLHARRVKKKHENEKRNFRDTIHNSLTT